jgi:hypothetical protein
MTAARRLASVVTLLASLAGCRGPSGPKVTLRYHPPTGATYHYALEQQNSMQMAGGPAGQLPGQEITLHIYYSQAVTGPTAGGIGVTVTYDSTTMLPAGMAPALDRMRGLTSKVVYDDRMHVVSATFTGIAGQASPLADQMGKSVKGMTLPLPDAPVGVGDSWTSETEMPIGEALGASTPLRSRTRLTVKEIQVAGADTSILLAVQTTFPGDPFTITQRGRQATVKLTGAIAGEQLFSLGKSVPVRYSMGGRMTIAVRDPQTGSAGMSLAMEQHTALQLTDSH